MKIPFTKMHGIGNDYVYVNGFETVIDDPASVAKRIADRHFGVGGDGLILVLPPESGVQADVRMRMFNADGSESEMCGNGIRCVCKFAHDRGISKAKPMRIQTGRGVLSLEYTTGATGFVDYVTVDMGEPLWNPGEVGVRVDLLDDLFVQLDSMGVDTLWVDRPVAVRERDTVSAFNAEPKAGVAAASRGGCLYQFVSLGNPHIVFFVNDVESIALEQVGPIVEHHEAFPNRINAHFVKVHSRHEVTMRTWERGSGITLACGTGAAAVCCAGVAMGLTDRKLLVHLPGGDLQLRWDQATNHVFKTGPATEVFTGIWFD